MMNTYRVISNYDIEFLNPIKVSCGDSVIIIESSDCNGDWPNWLLCKTNDNEGWIPSQIIQRQGARGTLSEDYSAVEFSLKIGEILFSNKSLNGWIWSFKKSRPDIFAWAPLNHLEIISSDEE